MSQKAIAFLDLTIWLGRDGRLGYSLHTKALNAFQYIPPYSFHAPSVARGWILTELFRIRRNSSTELARLYASLKFFKRCGSADTQRASSRAYSPLSLLGRDRRHRLLGVAGSTWFCPSIGQPACGLYKFVMREWYDSVPVCACRRRPWRRLQEQRHTRFLVSLELSCLELNSRWFVRLRTSGYLDTFREVLRVSGQEYTKSAHLVFRSRCSLFPSRIR